MVDPEISFSQGPMEEMVDNHLERPIVENQEHGLEKSLLSLDETLPDMDYSPIEGQEFIGEDQSQVGRDQGMEMDTLELLENPQKRNWSRFHNERIYLENPFGTW